LRCSDDGVLLDFLLRLSENTTLTRSWVNKGMVEDTGDNSLPFTETQYGLEDPSYPPSPKRAFSEPKCCLAKELKVAPGVVPCSSTSGSWPSFAENRTFRVLSVRIPDEQVRAACGQSEIPRLHAAFPHLMGARRDLVGTDRRWALRRIRFPRTGLREATEELVAHPLRPGPLAPEATGWRRARGSRCRKAPR
jgi:hypothetical protein